MKQGGGKDILSRSKGTWFLTWCWQFGPAALKLMCVREEAVAVPTDSLGEAERVLLALL